MPTQTKLKNTYSTSKNIFTTIQRELVNAGAKEVAFQYVDGKIMGISFAIVVGTRVLKYKMPVDIDTTLQVLRKEAKTPAQQRAATWDKAYQVSWATCRDMISAMMAMIKIKQVKLEQVFLPYLLDPSGRRTLYDIVEEEHFLLPEHTENF